MAELTQQEIISPKGPKKGLFISVKINNFENYLKNNVKNHQLSKIK